MVRWDSPLFTVLWEEQDVPAEDIWKAVMAGNVKPPNASTQAASFSKSSVFTSAYNMLTASLRRLLKRPPTHYILLNRQRRP